MRYALLIGRWREAEGRLPARNEGRQLSMDWSGQQSMRIKEIRFPQKVMFATGSDWSKGSKAMSGFS